jgi:glutamate-1-semialdehyde 2,1-aminomutase
MTKQSAVRDKICADYIAKTPKSKELFERAKHSLPGGIPSSKRYQEPYPLAFEYGRGSKIVDVDDNEYINTVLNAGPLLLGHDHPELMKAAKEAMERGFMVQNNALFIECAEMIQMRYPCAERVRFANTGTEAVLYALRTANAYTKKNKTIGFY